MTSASDLWVVRMVEERFHRDDEGRPLREGRTPPEHLQPGDLEYRPCPYPGSRQLASHPMNVSALRQTSVHWDEILDALAFLRTGYAALRGSYGPDVMDLWRVSQLGSALPWYFVLTGEPLPAYAAALSKATLGTGILAQRLILKMLAEAWSPPPFTTPALVALAESTGTLVGETEVCSASDKMIARFLDAIVSGSPRTGTAPTAATVAAPTASSATAPTANGATAPTASSATAPVTSAASSPATPVTIARLIAAGDRVLGFGACYANFKLTMWLYYQARRFLYADLAAALGPDPLRSLLEAPCEPPDFFVIEPANPAAVPPAIRAAWLGQLTNLLVPFAPDGSDRPLLDAAHRIAATMADDAADPIARAVATFAKLDAIWADIIACVEAGLRGTPCPTSIDAATRDRLVVTSPRALFDQLAARS